MSNPCFAGQWQHYLNPVELIETGPCSSLGQPLEELPHGLVIQTIRAVEDHTLERREDVGTIRDGFSHI